VKCGLKVAGTLGVLELAASFGLLDLALAVEKLQKTNARLDPSLVAGALSRERQRRGI